MAEPFQPARVTRADMVAEAREWIGTRWQHQCHLKRVATDCGGLVYGVGFIRRQFPEVAQLPQAAKFAGYSRVARNGSLVEACELLLVPIALALMQPADVVLMSFTGEPQHVGILGDYVHGGLSLIHAYAAQKRVIEHRLDPQTWAPRIHSAYRYPGVLDA